MKILGVVLIVCGAFLGLFGLANAMKPSTSPLATVVGGLAMPGLLIWWGVLLIRRGGQRRNDEA